MEEQLNLIRRQIEGFFGSSQGAMFIRRFVQPLDHLVYKVSGGRLLFLNAIIPTLMLTTTGAKSGAPRTVPLLYLRSGSTYVVIASNYGSTSHPAWYHNLRANPACAITVGGRTLPYRAREAEGAERDKLWQHAVILYAGYRSYQTRAGERRIPVMVLEPAA